MGTGVTNGVDQFRALDRDSRATVAGLAIEITLDAGFERILRVAVIAIRTVRGTVARV